MNPTADCIFCKIIRKEIPASIVYEDAEVMVFENIKPIAPIHLLIVPKRHIESVGTAVDGDLELLGKLQIVARDIARKQHLASFKLASNSGTAAGQSVLHLHYHLISGQIVPGGLQSL